MVSPSTLFSALVLPSLALATSFTRDTARSIDPSTHLAIQKTVNAFSFAVDARPIPQFNHIFTQDAFINLTIEGSQQQGIEAINEYFATLLPPFDTQHSFGTQKIELSSDGKTAYAVTHFIGTFFEAGVENPGYVMHFNQYQDTLVEVDGEWLILNKTVSFLTPPLGSISL